jgi:hypothetical protein
VIAAVCPARIRGCLAMGVLLTVPETCTGQRNLALRREQRGTPRLVG